MRPVGIELHACTSKPRTVSRPSTQKPTLKNAFASLSPRPASETSRCHIRHGEHIPQSLAVALCPSMSETTRCHSTTRHAMCLCRPCWTIILLLEAPTAFRTEQLYCDGSSIGMARVWTYPYELIRDRGRRNQSANFVSSKSSMAFDHIDDILRNMFNLGSVADFVAQQRVDLIRYLDLQANICVVRIEGAKE